jgi:hypothetical protein
MRQAFDRTSASGWIVRDLGALSTSASPLGPTLREAAERVGVPVAALLAVITGGGSRRSAKRGQRLISGSGVRVYCASGR